MTTAVAAPAGAASSPAVAALVELGVLDEIAASGARTEDISRAHPVWRVRLADGRSLVVKAGLGHGGPDLAVECLVYRMTWWCEPLADALPRSLAVDEDRQLLVLADVTDAGAGPGASAGTDAAVGSLAQRVGLPALLTGTPVTGPATGPVLPVWHRLGATVGRVHRGTAGFPLPPATPPLVLALVGLDAGRLADTPLEPSVRAAVADLAARRPVASAVDRLRHPVAGCLVNHDLKWDNVALAADRPVLLDWELAGAGDPAWDLGCLLAEHLVRGPVDGAARALLRGYADGARPRPATVDVLARRTALAAGLRIAQLGLEVAYTPASGDPEAVGRLADRATELLADPAGLTEEIRRCLC